MSFNEKKKVWSLRFTPGNSEVDGAISAIAARHGVSEVVAKLIYNRGYSEGAVGAFLTPVPSGLYDPYLMKDMD